MSYNLISEPWFTVETADTQQKVGIRDALLQAQDFVRIVNSSPAVLPALYRLLVSVAHRVVQGPKSLSGAMDLIEAGGFSEEQVNSYLEQVYDRFDLFHPEQPFYQVADSEDKVSGVSRLAAELASGTNKLLFDHTAEAQQPELSHAEVAQLLVARQMLAVPEGAGYSPSPVGGCALVLPQGHNLFETLVLNMLPYGEYEPEEDRPIWEQTPARYQKVVSTKPQTAHGVTERYTWLTRIVKLQSPEDAQPVTGLHYAPGIKFVADGKADPMVAYRIDEKRGLLPMSFRKNAAFWRNFHALIPAPNKKDFLAPATLAHANSLYVELRRDEPIEILVSGLSNDKAKVELWRTEHYRVPQALMTQSAYNELKRLLETADTSGRALYGACASLSRGLLSSGERSPDPADVRNLTNSMPASANYWSTLETRFPDLLERFSDAEPSDWWTEQIIAALRTAWGLALASAGQSATAWRAGAEASKPLNKHISELKSTLVQQAV